MSDVGVFVIGAARSGTSATARMVHALGVRMADDEHLKQPEEANPAGFFEVTHLTKVNHWIMEGFGGHSMAPPLFPEGWLEEPWIVELGDGARELFLDVYKSAPWVWKHPTTSVTLPFWTRILDVRPVIVMTIRHPLENAASIRGFRGNESMSARCSLAIWERYLRSAFSFAAGYPTYVASYSHLVEDPETLGRDMATFLAANGAIPDASIADRGLAGLVRPDFRHHAVDPDQIRDENAELSGAQQRLWKAARELVGPHDRFPAFDLGEETDWVAGILEEQNRYEWERERFRDNEKTLRRELKHAEKRRAKAVDAAEKLDQELANTRVKALEEAEKLREELAKTRVKALEETEKLTQELTKARDDKDNLKRKLRRSREVEEQRAARVEALEAELKRAPLDTV